MAIPERVALPLSTVKTINQPPIFIVLTVKNFTDAANMVKLKNTIAHSNILVGNFKVGGLDKFGLNYEILGWKFKTDLLFSDRFWAGRALRKPCWL